jgi:hypothetical protein
MDIHVEHQRVLPTFDVARQAFMEGFDGQGIDRNPGQDNAFRQGSS